MNKSHLGMILTLFRMGFFGDAHGWSEGEGGKKPPLPNISHTYPTMMKLGRILPKEVPQTILIT